MVLGFKNLFVKESTSRKSSIDDYLFEFGINPLWNELIHTFNKDNYHITNVERGTSMDVITPTGEAGEADKFLERFGCKSTMRDDTYFTYQRECNCNERNVIITIVDREIKRQ